MRWPTWLATSMCACALGRAATLDAGAPPQSGPDVLAFGVAVERPVTAGDDQVFSLTVTAGSAVLLAVDQQGADIRLSAAPAPVGPMVADEPDRGTAGRELLVWTVPADGVVAVTVSGIRADGAGGRYALRADRLEPVDGLAPAIDAFNEAATVTRSGTPAAAVEQVAALDAALDVWRRLGRRDLEAQTLIRLGLVQAQRAGRPLDALRSFTDAAALFEALRYEADLANAEVLLALAQRQAGQIHEAMRSGERAYARAARVPPRLRGRMESELSRTASDLGDSELGLRYARQAVATFRELGDKESLMTALERVADHTISMRRLDEALEAVDEAIALADIVAAPPRRRAGLLRTLGRVHGAGGDSEQAIVAFRRAADLMPQFTDRLVLDLDVSRHVNRLGDYAAARDLLEAALARIPAQERNVRAAVATELGVSLSKLGDHARARALQEEALAVVDASGSSRNQFVVLRDLLATVRAQGDPDAVRALTARLVAVGAKLPAGESRPMLLKEQARSARFAGDLAAAEAFVREAIEVSDVSRARLRGEALRTT